MNINPLISFPFLSFPFLSSPLLLVSWYKKLLTFVSSRSLWHTYLLLFLLSCLHLPTSSLNPVLRLLICSSPAPSVPALSSTSSHALLPPLPPHIPPPVHPLTPPPTRSSTSCHSLDVSLTFWLLASLHTSSMWKDMGGNSQSGLHKLKHLLYLGRDESKIPYSRTE